jgi:hypothetical protein
VSPCRLPETLSDLEQRRRELYVAGVNGQLDRELQRFVA